MITIKHKLSDEGMQQVRETLEAFNNLSQIQKSMKEVERFNDNMEKLAKFCEMVERGIVLSKFTSQEGQ